MKTYTPRVPTHGNIYNSNRQFQEVADEHNIDIGDEMDLDADMVVDDTDDTVEDDCREIEVYDLTSDPPSSPPPQIIERTPAPDLVDEYLDGLAYRVGQIETSPIGAAKATVEFAGKMKTQHAKQSKLKTPDGKKIDKPLPATPVTELPVWMRDVQESIEPLELPAAADSPRVRNRDGLRRSRAHPSGFERFPLGERSPRQYRISTRERTSLSEVPNRRGSIRVDIPARARVAEIWNTL